MKLPIYQVDAFTNGPFTGNPAAVCPLVKWLDDQTMQNIAMENNLSETAFFVPQNGHFHLRWFTPAVEVDLCGHATLATAHALFHILDYNKEEIQFETRSGILKVTRDGDDLVMDFPADQLEEVDAETSIVKALGKSPVACYQGRSDRMYVYDSEDDIVAMKPDFNTLAQVGGRGLIVTAPGQGSNDFVSRGFFPQSGIDEDPATGSAHTTLTPYWSNRLGKKDLKACQLSQRKGFFHCIDKGDRVILKGKARTYLKGEIFL